MEKHGFTHDSFLVVHSPDDFVRDEEKTLEENRKKLAEGYAVSDYINAEHTLKENLYTTLFFILNTGQDVLEDMIETEREWKRDDVFEDKIREWKAVAPNAFTGGFLASYDALKHAVADGTISPDAPWFKNLQQRMNIVDILLLG